MRVFVSKRQTSLIPDENNLDPLWTLSSSFLSLVAFVKLLGYSRIFKDYSKLSTLLITVMVGLAPFNVLFFSIVLYDAFLMTIAGSREYAEDDFPSDSVNAVFAQIIQSFRNSIGDINYPSYATWANSDKQWLMSTWITVEFVAACYLKVVVLLNFLIASISQTYEEVTSKEEAYQIDNMADIIMETAILIDAVDAFKKKKFDGFQSVILKLGAPEEGSTDAF